jgi:hypothetical protein
MYHREPPTGYLLPDDMEQAHIKMTRQTDNEHLGISFIYHWYSFLLWDASSNDHYGHAINFHHEWCMAEISGPGVSLTHIQTPWSHKIPTFFTSRVSINKRSRYQLKWEKVQCWKLAPWWHGWANFQLTTSKHNINIREPQCQNY